MCWKLAFVAAVALLLAIVAGLWSAPALAQPSQHTFSYLATGVSFPRTLVHRAAPPDGAEQERRLSPGPILGLICAIAASSVALGIAFGLRRRIDRIAGPDPDKNDDD